jgi:hypothetical protein
MAPRSRVRARPRFEQEIEENGLAVFAVHRKPFQLRYFGLIPSETSRVNFIVLNKILQLIAKRLVGAKE